MRKLTHGGSRTQTFEIHVDDMLTLYAQITWEYERCGFGTCLVSYVHELSLENDAPVWAHAIRDWLRRFDEPIARRCVEEFELRDGSRHAVDINTAHLCSVADVRSVASIDVDAGVLS